MQSRSVNRALWLGGGVLIGWATAGSIGLAASDGPGSLYQKLQVFSEVLAHVENLYVDAVSAENLIYGATRGAVSVLDSHSMFFTPSEYKGLLDATEGEYAGVGVEVEMVDGGAEVVNVLEESPAAQAGLKAGDLIVAIDGQTVAGRGFDSIHGALAGPVGTKVVLSVARNDGKPTWTFTLIRNWIRVPPMEAHSMPGEVLYVHLKNFPRRVAADLDGLLSRHHPKGLVIDLRNNPGGLFDEAIEVCDLFLKGGLVVTATGKQGREVETHQARERAPYLDMPLAILIDRGSASAAEVVAGALKDRGRARLFGQRSYGKGSVQSILDLSDGSGLKLTIARYVTPSGEPIDGHGIEPNVETEPASADSDDALLQALKWLGEQ